MKNFKLIEQIGKEKEHLLFCGDNLEIMKICKNLKGTCFGKIGLIYIDPPYNTGKKMGKYNDNYKSHQDWLDFMKPRLILAKEFLADSGIIAISIGENEEAYLKIVCNEIFGENNKISSIIWQSKYTVSNDKIGISTQTEYIIMYAKNIKNITINADPLRPEYIKSAYRNADDDPRGFWRGGIQLYKKKNPHSYTVTSPTGKEWTMPWNYSESQWKEVLEKEELIYWGKDGNSCPVKKVFLKDSKGTSIRNLWLGEEVGYTADGGNILENMFGDRNEFLYPKPVSLMHKILQVASQKNSLVMDFFAGSGTFGHAVLECNRDDGGTRKFILITNNENNICDKVTFPRLKNVIKGYTGQDNKIFPPTNGQLSYYQLTK